MNQPPETQYSVYGADGIWTPPLSRPELYAAIRNGLVPPSTPICETSDGRIYRAAENPVLRPLYTASPTSAELFNYLQSPIGENKKLNNSPLSNAASRPDIVTTAKSSFWVTGLAVAGLCFALGVAFPALGLTLFLMGLFAFFMVLFLGLGVAKGSRNEKACLAALWRTTLIIAFPFVTLGLGAAVRSLAPRPAPPITTGPIEYAPPNYYAPPAAVVDEAEEMRRLQEAHQSALQQVYGPPPESVPVVVPVYGTTPTYRSGYRTPSDSRPKNQRVSGYTTRSGKRVSGYSRRSRR